jgi:hypothetical protein
MPRGVYVRTEEYRQKLHFAMLGHKNPKSLATRKKLSDAQKGKPKSDAFRQKCHDRMVGRPGFFTGKRHTKEWIEQMKERLLGANHWNWRGGVCSGMSKSDYAVALQRHKAGFSEELFAERLAEQGGCCPICGMKLEMRGLTFAVASADHDHEAGTPRGILCKRCNFLLGNAKDDIEILQKAIVYLNFWKRTS